MEYKKVANSLEKIKEQEIQIRNSKEYRTGLKICRAIEDIRSFHILKFINREIRYRKIAKYNYKWNISDDNFSYGDYPDDSKKFVVYTCITGGYDNLHDPLYVHPNIDYVVYTDNLNMKSSIWKVRPIPDHIKKIDNNILINRYFKFNPHKIFKEYNYSLYIDGNIVVISDVRNMINRLNEKTGIALHRHSCRHCIYKEAEVCKIEKRGNYKLIYEQISEYRKKGFPEDFGLYEANIILADLKNPNIDTLFSKWWTEFKNSKSLRDQIAIPYVVWNCGYKFDDIGNLGINMHNNPKIEKCNHI